MYKSFDFPVEDLPLFKKKLLHWCSRFSSFSFLNSSGYQLPHSRADVLVGAGVLEEITLNAPQTLSSLKKFLAQHEHRFLFGHVGYGISSITMQLPLQSAPAHLFSDLSFFVPQHVIKLGRGVASVYAPTGYDASTLLEQINATELKNERFTNLKSANGFQPVISRSSYLETINQLLKHIHRGDCYEINFCQQFKAEIGDEIDVVLLYETLDQQSPNPFGGLYRREANWLLCASPERFVQRNGLQLLSQPIKGTSKRSGFDFHATEDERLRLASSEKDRAENVMVVDLVRNDLSRVCQPGSVKVEELFGIYSFPQVHQMISTITGRVRANVSFTDILTNCFPMGSMTGAPKKRVVELIDRYEAAARGLYSGAIGYITPDGNFDFNVVIRSLVYNATVRELQFHVGGGITAYSVPEKEYDECLIKASPLLRLL